MSTELSRQFPLHEGMLNKEHYAQSLLQQAGQLGLITAEQAERIQLETAVLLQKQLTRFTHGVSSSVKAETAHGILSSLLFNVSLALKSLPDIPAQLDSLKSEELEVLHNQGREIAKVKVVRAKELLAKVQHTRVHTDNEAYNQTIDTAMPDFFRAYDLYYAAHDIPCMIDYPLCAEGVTLAGIEYIEAYLQKLAFENAFCACFDSVEVSRLLISYHPEFKDLLENIFALTLTNALGSILLGKGGGHLRLTQEDVSELLSRLAPLSQQEFERVTDAAKEGLPGTVGVQGNPMQEYMNDCMNAILPRINVARLNDAQPVPFTVFKTAGEGEALVFRDRERMDDERFRRLTEELRDCRNVADKLLLVRRQVKSFGDLADILAAECFFNEEYTALFGSLQDFELALLYQALPKDEEDGLLHRSEAEKQWQASLTAYLSALETSRRKAIEALAKHTRQAP